MDSEAQTIASKKTSKPLDLAGIIFSLACAIHCLAFPILVSLVPSLTTHLDNEWIHFGFLATLVPVALVSFVRSKKDHNNPRPLVLGVLGISLLLSAVFVEHLGVHAGETLLTVLGSITLISAHIMNMRARASRKTQS